MAAIKLIPASGGGSVSLAPPNSTSGADVTFTLPSTSQSFGKLLQVVSTAKTDTWSSSAANSSFVDITGFSVNITPTHSSNKIYITGFATISQSTSAAYRMALQLMRDSTAIGIGAADGNRTRCTVGTQGMAHADSSPAFPFAFLDSPNTTSQVTYKMQMMGEHSTVYVNRSGAENDGDSALTPRMISVITAMEVAA
tara:strand:+ start:1294 stop:1884 length:591 start_codon:yes stop_codon:yes gene_type:complete